MERKRRKRPLTLDIKCGSMELQLWALAGTLPRKERTLIRNYMKTRDELEARAVKRALRSCPAPKKKPRA